MLWNFQSDRPIYLQIKEQIMRSIISGEYPPGSKIPAVRDIAVEAAVNPNTVQKALSELEREGLLFAQRTSGRYVTEETELIERTKSGLAHEILGNFLEKMKAIGYSAEDAKKLIEEKTGVKD